ncbi:hypothetical protein I6N96_01110 [Enterococcus sp. BWM-S5]|uniref:Uncharacterized protein n=1 Tax=Enterococcus larvae TaxID=2794352 RepID=A0ABS4CFT8_9ENTE|nr:hypothetical protein [Enterococcus larvae]MBP1044860.1 hypothetical protein [Enterococcus larvae]
MIFRKKKQLAFLAHRVQQMEEVLCPNKQHDWITYDKEMVATSLYPDFKDIQICKRCKKERKINSDVVRFGG